jgi:hypothetical protein
MSEGQTTPTVESTSIQATPARPEKVKMQVSAGGGGFGLDDFNRAIGVDVDKVDEADEPEQEQGTGELVDSDEDQFGEKKPKKEEAEEDEESEDADEDGDNEDSEESEDGDEKDNDKLDELSASAKKGAIKAFTKDGKEVNLPPDLEIEQMVDGEPVKINLREHLNVVAGELTVNSRLGKIASFREQVEQRRKEVENIHTKFNTDIQTLVSFVEKGKPELAICYLAELNGMSPIEMKKQFLKSVVAEAQRFEGKSELEIENYYLNLERQWRQRKEQKALEASKKEQEANGFVQKVNGILERENLTPVDFTKASDVLRAEGELEGLSREEALSRVVEHALLVKHVSMAKSAIEAVDPKLTQNKKLFNTLLDLTHPNKFTVEEMSAVLREYLGKTTNRIASSLSKKVQPNKAAKYKSEKQNEAGKKKIFRSAAELGKAFGLS